MGDDAAIGRYWLAQGSLEENGTARLFGAAEARAPPKDGSGRDAAARDGRLYGTPLASFMAMLEALLAVSIFILIVGLATGLTEVLLGAENVAEECKRGADGLALAVIRCTWTSAPEVVAASLLRSVFAAGITFVLCIAYFMRFLNLSWSDVVRVLGVARPRLAADGLVSTISLFHVLGLAVLYFLYTLGGREAAAFTLDNFISPVDRAADASEGVFRAGAALDLIVLTPLKEELIFRGIVLLTLKNRIREPASCIAIGGLWFGALHMVNFATSRFSFFYTALQVMLGFEIGICYGYRAVLSRGLFEPFLLHVVNNVTSSVFSADAVDMDDPVLAFSITCTIFFFARMIRLSHVRLRREVDDLGAADDAADKSDAGDTKRGKRDKDGARRRR